jgi:hypothetical protein
MNKDRSDLKAQSIDANVVPLDSVVGTFKISRWNVLKPKC